MPTFSDHDLSIAIAGAGLRTLYMAEYAAGGDGNGDRVSAHCVYGHKPTDGVPRCTYMSSGIRPLVLETMREHMDSHMLAIHAGVVRAAHSCWAGRAYEEIKVRTHVKSFTRAEAAALLAATAESTRLVATLIVIGDRSRPRAIKARCAYIGPPRCGWELVGSETYLRAKAAQHVGQHDTTGLLQEARRLTARAVATGPEDLDDLLGMVPRLALTTSVITPTAPKLALTGRPRDIARWPYLGDEATLDVVRTEALRLVRDAIDATEAITLGREATTAGLVVRHIIPHRCNANRERIEYRVSLTAPDGTVWSEGSHETADSVRSQIAYWRETMCGMVRPETLADMETMSAQPGHDDTEPTTVGPRLAGPDEPIELPPGSPPIGSLVKWWRGGYRYGWVQNHNLVVDRAGPETLMAMVRLVNVHNVTLNECNNIPQYRDVDVTLLTRADWCVHCGAVLDDNGADRAGNRQTLDPGVGIGEEHIHTHKPERG